MRCHVQLFSPKLRSISRNSHTHLVTRQPKEGKRIRIHTELKTVGDFTIFTNQFLLFSFGFNNLNSKLSHDKPGPRKPGI